MLEFLLGPLIPHLTIIGLLFDVAGIAIILVENFLPEMKNKIDDWLSTLTYVGFTRRLETPIIFTYDALCKYIFIPMFIYFVIASFYGFEIVKNIVKDKWDFFEIILIFVSYFMGYMMFALLFIWWALPLLFVFSSKFVYKNKSLSGVGFMLIIIGILFNIPQILYES